MSEGEDFDEVVLKHGVDELRRRADAVPEAELPSDKADADDEKTDNVFTFRPRKKTKPEPEPGDDERSPAFTDDALALIFAEEQASELRYVAALGKWVLWNATHWDFDETLLVRDRARRVCRKAAVACNNPKHRKIIASAKTVRAVEHLTQSDRRIAATVEQWDKDDWLLNTPSGTIDLRTGQSGPHRPSDYITKQSDVVPDDSCPIPTWLTYLDKVTANRQELIAYLQRMTGYALTGSIQEHALFFLYGTGANGKTTFLNTVTSCIGEYHRTAPIETFTATTQERHPTDVAGLRGARLVTATETEEGRRWAESRIKALTGGDKISARFMRQDFFEFSPKFKLLIAGNHKPSLRSVDEAIRRRFNLIPFTVTIPTAERDEKLSEKLKVELPGILAWMIRGCLDWQQRGLNPPAVITEATEAYLQAEDSMAAWIDEAGVRDPSAWERSTDLFTSWSAWATKAGEFVGTLKRFTQSFEDKGFVRQPRRDGKGFLGFRLTSSTTTW
jgi:putative DNA primase/helicase